MGAKHGLYKKEDIQQLEVFEMWMWRRMNDESIVA